VLIYHDINPSLCEAFANQLRWLSRRWKFVSPAQFGAMVDGEVPIRGDNLMLTFDDGFASNRLIAEKVLNPMGIKALFFVVSDLVAIDNQEKAKEYIDRNIKSVESGQEIPYDWNNMGWSDLESLLEQGHVIGGHTKTHARLSDITEPALLYDEIVRSADSLERYLRTKIEHFAYTYGNLASFSPEAMAVARNRFCYVYSGLRGDNAPGVFSAALRRDSIKASDSHCLIGAFLEGGADPLYAGKRRVLDQWAISCASCSS